MDNWGTEENKKKESDIARKIIIVMMVLLILVIGAILFLLYNIKINTFSILIDGKSISDTNNLMLTIKNTTYINIEKLSKLLGYDYHSGEYKGYSSSGIDKCYIQSNIETASFYLNSNKICKLKVGELTEDYEVFNSQKSIIKQNNMFYAPLDAIKIAFNIDIQSTEKSLNITTLQTLVAKENAKFNGTTQVYKSFLQGTFDNQKAILYDLIIVSKKDSNLYGVITTSGKELLPDKYSNITFLESTKEFLVTNSSGKIGIIDANGQNKIEQLYDDIKLINKEPKLYLVKTSNKYGVVDSNGNVIVYPEYDSIGINASNYKDIQNQHVLLDSIIPVCKDKKYGLFNIKGERVLDVQYDGIGCELKSININGVSKAINPAVIIEECNGIVIKNGESYDLFLVEESKYQKISEAIYYLTSEGNKTYYMLLNGIEYDLIDELIKANVISQKIDTENTISNNTIENTIDNNVTGNFVENNIVQ